jgi:predicted RNA binding protein YcfA (HicA-like mRNA interferase family)
MTKVPILSYDRVLRELRRDGWVLYGKKGVISAFKNRLRKKSSNSLFPLIDR